MASARQGSWTARKPSSGAGGYGAARRAWPRRPRRRGPAPAGPARPGRWPWKVRIARRVASAQAITSGQRIAVFPPQPAGATGGSGPPPRPEGISSETAPAAVRSIADRHRPKSSPSAIERSCSDRNGPARPARSRRRQAPRHRRPRGVPQGLVPRSAPPAPASGPSSASRCSSSQGQRWPRRRARRLVASRSISGPGPLVATQGWPLDVPHRPAGVGEPRPGRPRGPGRTSVPTGSGGLAALAGRRASGPPRSWMATVAQGPS